MKKLPFLSFLTILTLVTILTPSQAQAHFLATDKNIGAVLHIDPTDQPIAGQPASLFLEFKDKQNQLDPKNCDCTIVITQNGKTVLSQPIFQNNTNPSLTSANLVYTFPQKAVYQIKVTGKPLTPNAFQPFTLTWNLRVDQEINTQTTPKPDDKITNYLLSSIAVVIIIILFFAYQTNRPKKTKNKQED